MDCCGKVLRAGTVAFITFILLTSAALPGELTEEKIVHVVKADETIERISFRYQVPEEKIRKINKLKESTSVKPGQRLELSRKKIIPRKMEDGLIINLPEYAVYQFNKGEIRNIYPIAIGRKNWQTPRGKFTIANKTRSPTWRVPPRMSRVYERERELIPPGPENPLGEYWIGLSLPHIGIHSTNQTKSVGRSISHGCMRMFPDDAENFFNSVDVGVPGEIIYEPVKIATGNGYVYLEIHEDIYGMYPDIYNHTVSSLKKLGVYEYTDEEKLRSVIDKKSGEPVSVSISRVIGLDELKESSGTKKLWNRFDINKTNLPKMRENL